MEKLFTEIEIPVYVAEKLEDTFSHTYKGRILWPRTKKVIKENLLCTHKDFRGFYQSSQLVVDLVSQQTIIVCSQSAGDTYQLSYLGMKNSKVVVADKSKQRKATAR